MSTTSAANAVDHIGLACYVANRFRRFAAARQADMDDVRGEAVLGLVRAAREYKDDRGASFATYACVVIRRAIATELTGPRYRNMLPLPADENGETLDVLDTRSAEDQTTEQRDQAALLHTWMRRLTPRESQVIGLRYGLVDGRERSLEDVGQVLSLTRERIRQVEARALQRLRSAAGCDGEDPAPADIAEAATTAK